ncbi:hypothetical protein [Heliothis virescens ascovirus 3e]|uniref:Uncharacterized protein n=2 Tax=Ascovirus hvav3a TaxID=3444724 RepID=A4KX80_HVAVE|nr:hypothetical protein HVAV3e_gp024 [Heliothis virescens ascovirus 3e]ABO37211.1 hypothetical protein [Heliothis virescens ascovirus 3e]
MGTSVDYQPTDLPIVNMFRKKCKSASSAEASRASSAVRREVCLSPGANILTPEREQTRDSHEIYINAWKSYCEQYDRKVTVNTDYFVLFEDKIAKRSFKSQKTWLKSQLRDVGSDYRNHYDDTLYDTSVKYLVVDSAGLQKVAMRHASNDALNAIVYRISGLLRCRRTNEILDQVALKCTNKPTTGAYDGSNMMVY